MHYFFFLKSGIQKEHEVQQVVIGPYDFQELYNLMLASSREEVLMLQWFNVKKKNVSFFTASKSPA